jgi:hypothetical protein
VGATDPYHGVVTLENIPATASRVARYVSGSKFGLAFSRNRTLYAHGATRDLEPSARVDYQGNAYAGAIRGLTAGNDLWRFDLNPTSKTYDPFLRGAAFQIDSNGNIVNPSYKGQPDAIKPNQPNDEGGEGGGDLDMAVSFTASSGAPPVLATTSLLAANITSQQSLDRGNTFARNPAGNILIPEDDRPWMEFLGDHVVYLGYRELAGLQLTSHYYVNRSDDGGLTYGPAVLASTGGNTTANIDVDQNDGTVYFCHQGPDAQNNQVLITVGHPRAAGLAPTEADYTTYVASIGQQSNISFLFPVCKVASDGTVYVAYSDGGKDIYLTDSLDQGKTWAQPVRVSNLRGPSSSFFPWMATGKRPGSLAIVWYGAEGPDSEDGQGANNGNANWKVFFAETLNGTTTNPTFYQTVASDHFVHASNISVLGLGGAANRNLGDFFQVAVDASGLAFIAFDDDSNDFSGNTYVTHQIGGISLNTGGVVHISGTDPVTAPNPSDPQVKDERHDARASNLFQPIPDIDTPADILTIQYGCQATGTATWLTARMRLSGLTAVPPQGVWRINFATNPTKPGVSDRADQWYLEADTDAAGNQTYVYGTAVRNSDGSLTYTPAGTADYGAFNVLNSSVTLKVDIAKLNALQTHGRIGNGTRFIGLRGSSSVENYVVSTSAAGVSVGLQDVARGGTSYTLNTSSCTKN